MLADGPRSRPKTVPTTHHRPSKAMRARRRFVGTASSNQAKSAREIAPRHVRTADARSSASRARPKSAPPAAWRPALKLSVRMGMAAARPRATSGMTLTARPGVTTASAKPVRPAILVELPERLSANGCQVRKLVNPGACAAECVDDRQQTVCVSGDGCCPSRCNTSNDGDCEPRCGNGVVETGEKCDPVSSCPSSCPNLGCNLRRLNAGGTCAAECVANGTQTACRSDDDCCPSNCNNNNDSDCPIRCGNGAREGSERCDPLSSCPTSLPEPGMSNPKARGSAAPATHTVKMAARRRQCRSGDGCCPGLKL